MAFNSLINSMQNMKSIGDYQKLEEEFQLKKAQAAQQQQMNDIAMQKAQAEMAQPDIEGLASRSLFEYHQGRPLSPQGKAALETLAVLKGSSVKYQPDEFGNVRAVSEPNPYQQFLGNSSAPSFGGDPMAASRAAVSQRQSEIGSNPYGTMPQNLVYNDMTTDDIEAAIGPNNPGMTLGGQKKPSDLSQMAFNPKNAPSLDPEIVSSPYGRKKLFDQQLTLMGDINNPSTEIGKMQKDEKLGLVPPGSTQTLIKEKSRQTRKEDMALESQEKAAKEAERVEKITKEIVTDKIKKSIARLKKDPTASGRLSTFGSYLPGKAASYDVLTSDYDTIKSNLAMDKLMQLKAASSTGATGFGALSEGELKIVSDYASALNAELPYEKQIEALGLIAKAMGLDIPELAGEEDPIDAELRRRKGL